jgi:hypothetical protein
MREKDEKLEQLTATMIEKLSQWREVANTLNKKDLVSHDDVEAYFATDKAFTDAKLAWEEHLKQLVNK